MTLQEYNDLFKMSIVKKMYITSSGGITITNTNICSEQMSLEESLFSDANIRFGECESSCFKIRVADIAHNFVGEWLDVYMDVYTDEEGYLLAENGDYLLTESGERILFQGIEGSSRIHIGQYKVYSDKPTNDRTWRDLTCYDAMYDILNVDVSSWYSSLTFPMTIKDFRDSFFAEVGITQENVTLINDLFEFQGGFVVEGDLSGKTVINSICEFNGVFGHINSDKKFEYVSLDAAQTLTLDWYVDGTGSYEDYVTDLITGIVARANGDDVGTTVGTTVNPYILDNNPLIYGTEGTAELTTALTNLLTKIGTISYRPFRVTTYGNPMLPLGTQVTVNTRDETVVSYVVGKMMHGIQALKDTLVSEGDKKLPSTVNNIQSQIKRTMGLVHEVISDVTQISSTIYDSTNGLVTQIAQTKDQVVLKVDTNGNIVEVKLGVSPDDPSATVFKVTADNIDFIANDAMQLTAKNLGITSTNFSVTPAGLMSAKLGDIAGWTINANHIYKEVTVGDTTYAPTLSSSTAAGVDGFAFSISQTSGATTTYPFVVRYDGRLECSKLTATGGSLGGWIINANNIYKEVTASGVTYATTLSSSASSGENGFAFSVSRTENGTTTYPVVIRNSGKFECTDGSFKGAVNTTSLKIDNQANLSITTRTITETSFDIYPTYVTVTSSAISANVLQISSGYGLYIPDVTEFGSFVKFDDGIQSAALQCTKFYTAGSAYVTGWVHAGGLEIKGGTPFIDFHMGADDNTDFTCRVCQRATDTLDFLGHDSSTWGILRAAQFAVQSSKHVKENIETISENEAKKILKLNPVKFDYILGDKNQRGLIAEEVQDILPELVNVPEGYEVFNPDEPWNTPSIDYSKFVPYLIKMIQIQQKQIDKLMKK